jgi:hypothetical protein
MIINERQRATRRYMINGAYFKEIAALKRQASLFENTHV